MSKKMTEFFDLADIPLRCIIQYLPIQERFMLFVHLPPSRIESLLEIFISSIDISNEDAEWIEKYLSIALLEQKIVVLRLKDEQISSVSKYISQDSIQTMYLILTCFNDQFSTDLFIPFCKSLNKLILSFHIKSRNKQIKTYPIIGQNLLNLSTISGIFDILQRLPNLQI